MKIIGWDYPEKENEMKKLREQIQEDIMTYMNPLLDNDYEFTNLNVDDLCQIVVDNFKKLEE